MNLPFLPGLPSQNPGPLARFLPPLPEGVAAGYLERHTRPGDLVLDPFGVSPRVAVEAAFLGRRVLVAVNNPINRFVLEMAASPPAPAALKSVLAKLAAARKDGERLEPHLGNLYSTRCHHCARRIPAEYFVWEKDAPAPSARVYICPHCGDRGEYPVTQADVDLARAYRRGGLPYALALERIAPPDDPDREHAEAALAVYPPRAIYSLFTLLNKLESLNLPPTERRLADALLLSAFDTTNALWSHAETRPRPRALTIPPRYREHNVWLALERAVNHWTFPNQPFNISYWPPAGDSDPAAIAIFDGPIRALAAAHQQPDEPPETLAVALALTPLPRPNQAFWTLSALWAAWLWGREAAASFKPVLRRRRYDWNWHTTALHAAGESLAALLPEGTPFVSLLLEAEPGFTAAALTAFAGAGFALQGRALRADRGQLQLLWQRSAEPPRVFNRLENLQSTIQLTGREAGREALRQRGEPARWPTLHAAAWSELARRRVLAGLFTRDRQEQPPLSFVNETLAGAISYRKGFLRYGGGESDPESGQWWLRDEQGAAVPLADRVEAEVHRRLAGAADDTLALTAAELDDAICAAFPGLLTPGERLVAACLRSYADETEPGSGEWRLRPEDDPALRAAELDAIRQTLIALGHRLGYDVTGSAPLEWQLAGETLYALAVITSAAVGRYTLNPALIPTRSLLVLPGGRAVLVRYKLKRDPRLKLAVDRGWRFVKFRLVRRLADDKTLTRKNFDDRLKMDPLGQTDAQLSLL